MDRPAVVTGVQPFGSRRTRRWVIDGALLGLLLVTMAGPVVGFLTHEGAGTLLVALVAYHLLSTERWSYHFLPGQSGNPAPRALLNNGLLIFFLISAVSGIWISKSIFHFLPTHRTLFLRHLHTASSYWFFLLLGWHLCLHRRQFMAKLRRRLTSDRLRVVVPFTLRALLGFGAVTGGYLFARWDIYHRAILQTRFGGAPRHDPLAINLIGHLLLLCSVAAIAYGLQRSWRMIRTRRSG